MQSNTIQIGKAICSTCDHVAEMEYRRNGHVFCSISCEDAYNEVNGFPEDDEDDDDDLEDFMYERDLDFNFGEGEL